MIVYPEKITKFLKNRHIWPEIAFLFFGKHQKVLYWIDYFMITGGIKDGKNLLGILSSSYILDYSRGMLEGKGNSGDYIYALEYCDLYIDYFNRNFPTSRNNKDRDAYLYDVFKRYLWNHRKDAI